MDMLQEMLRVGKMGIVSFPNFAHWRVRAYLTVRGRMPVTEGLPFQWHNTPNIHLFCIADFLDWAKEKDVQVESGYVLARGAVRPYQDGDNAEAAEALLIVRQA